MTLRKYSTWQFTSELTPACCRAATPPLPRVRGQVDSLPPGSAIEGRGARTSSGCAARDDIGGR